MNFANFAKICTSRGKPKRGIGDICTAVGKLLCLRCGVVSRARRYWASGIHQRVVPYGVEGGDGFGLAAVNIGKNGDELAQVVHPGAKPGFELRLVLPGLGEW